MITNIGCESGENLYPDILKEKGYSIIKLLTEVNAMKVYLAKNSQDVTVVIKENKIEGSSVRKKIFRAQKSMLLYNFTNVVKYLDVFMQDDYLFIVLEYCENLDLLNYIENNKSGSEEERLEFIWRTIIYSSVAIDELHDRGIIHKDIRPENILLTSDNYAKIGSPDLFGNVNGKEKLSIQGYTLAPESLGYISKELFIDGIFSKKSYIWALGAVFYYLATGVKLFNTTDKNIISKGIYDEKPLEKLDEDLKYIIKFLLQVDPEKRPYSDDILQDEIFRKYCKKYGYEEKLKPFLEGPVTKFDIVNISDNDYPIPAKEDDDVYKICIVTTADIHGHAFPVKQKNAKTGEEYEIGGLTYFSKYLQILRDEWKEKLIYLDAGDTYVGGLESKLSNGEIMVDYFNYIKCDAITFGNHEFDNGFKFLDEYMNKIKTPFISSNVLKKDTNEPYAKNTSVILNVGKVKLGIIAVSTCDTPNTSACDFSNIIFKNCTEVIKQEAAKLRPLVNAVVLFCHIGLECYSPPMQQDNYGLYDSEYDNGSREKGELKEILDELPDGTVDVVIAGHLHQNYHYYYKGIPVVIPKDCGHYMNAIYLSFDKNGKMMNYDTVIEGAIPITNKLYYGKRSSEKDRNEKLYNVSYHGVQIEADENLEKIFEKYKKKLEEYSEVILTVDQPTYVYKESRETVLGDVVCDILIEETKANFAIMSSGAFRTTWKPGEVTKGMIMEMFPFANTIVSFTMTGEIIYRVLETILNGRKYQVGGLQYKFQRVLKDDQETIKIVSIIDEKTGKEINKNQEYKVASYDFLIPKFGDDFVKVKEYYTPKDLSYFGTLFEVALAGLKRVGRINYEEYRKKTPERVMVV